MNAALGILVAVLVFSSPVAAQMAGLGAGARVRVTSPSDDLKRHVATVMEVRGDSIVVAGRAGSRTIAISNVTALDVNAGTRTQVLRDGLIGFGAGALFGGIVGAATYEGPDLFVSSPQQAGALVGTMFGAVGLVVGGVVGAFHRTDRWQPARMPVRAAIIPSRSGGVSLNFSRAF